MDPRHTGPHTSPSPRPRPRVVAVAVQKGGTGKTTLSASLAVAATQAGERVTAFDLDPQGSLAGWGAMRPRGNPVVDRIQPWEIAQMPEILGQFAEQQRLAVRHKKGLTRRPLVRQREGDRIRRIPPRQEAAPRPAAEGQGQGPLRQPKQRMNAAAPALAIDRRETQHRATRRAAFHGAPERGFGGELRGGIAVLRRGRAILPDRRGTERVNEKRRGENEPAGAAPHRAIGERHRRRDIGAHEGCVIARGRVAAFGVEGGQMRHGVEPVRPVGPAVDGGEIAGKAAFAPARGQNLVPMCAQKGNERAADEAVAAGDENAHGLDFP